MNSVFSAVRLSSCGPSRCTLYWPNAVTCAATLPAVRLPPLQSGQRCFSNHMAMPLSVKPFTPSSRTAACQATAFGLENTAFTEALSSAPAMEQTSLAFTIAEQMSPETAGAIASVLGPFFSISTILMILRIVTTWYPEIDGSKLPWSAVFFPTEWILAPSRKVIPPQFGVDVSPIVWVAIISFLNEILIGPQGILNLIIREQLAT
uniref:YggT family protein n=1 Tax=Tetraselmis sp. GSL018 TaxID=582737 RepID=A0A061RYK5_9CHLO